LTPANAPREVRLEDEDSVDTTNQETVHVSEANAPVLNAATRLAVERTRLAYERTLMAWVRTATSLITFGFSIYKFFQIELGRGVPKSDRLIGPREFALFMIVIGLFSLLMATLENRRDLKAVKTEYHVKVHSSLAQVCAALVSLLGILALIAVILRR
jgi:putative membrane protein